MKINKFIMLVLLMSLTGCRSEPSREELIPSSSYAEPSTQSSSIVPTQVESIERIMQSAESVEYLSGNEWLSVDMESTEAKNLVEKIIGEFPEKFGGVAAAYIPEDIIIKFHLGEAAGYDLDVNSGAVPNVKRIEIAFIEISGNGILFFMPEGTALGSMKDVEGILPDPNKSNR